MAVDKDIELDEFDESDSEQPSGGSCAARTTKPMIWAGYLPQFENREVKKISLYPCHCCVRSVKLCEKMIGA